MHATSPAPQYTHEATLLTAMNNKSEQYLDTEKKRIPLYHSSKIIQKHMNSGQKLTEPATGTYRDKDTKSPH